MTTPPEPAPRSLGETMSRPSVERTTTPGPPLISGPDYAPAPGKTLPTPEVMEQVVFPEPPRSGRLLGIDYGDKRLGFAISTPDQTISSAIENYTRRTSALDLQQIKHWCEEYLVRGLVIGLPIHMNGLESQKSTHCRRFADWLYQHIGIPIAMHDERCTTAVVIDHLIELDFSRKQRKKKLDMLAAQVLLESYLNSRQPLRGSEQKLADEEDSPGGL